jgi:hypothetical protein
MEPSGFMIGYLNKCPHCGGDSSFVLEEMECDKSLVAWCKNCGNYINQTITLETIRRWWSRYEEGEENINPPVSKVYLGVLEDVERLIKNDSDCFFDRVEIHLKDFTEYKFTGEGDSDEGKRDS